MKTFKPDKWLKAYGSAIPTGAMVRVIRNFARRKVLVEYEGKRYSTMLWCLRREE